MKNFLLYFFAFIGICSLIYFTIGFYKMKTANDKIISYYNNCEKVKAGMTLKEARKIVGDLKYQYWYADEISGEIIVTEIGDNVKYTLEYPDYFGGSENIQIEFDPNTLIVTNVFCGE